MCIHCVTVRKSVSFVEACTHVRRRFWGRKAYARRELQIGVQRRRSSVGHYYYAIGSSGQTPFSPAQNLSNSKASKRRHLTVFTHTYHTDKRMFIYWYVPIRSGFVAHSTLYSAAAHRLHKALTLLLLQRVSLPTSASWCPTFRMHLCSSGFAVISPWGCAVNRWGPRPRTADVT